MQRISRRLSVLLPYVLAVNGALYGAETFYIAVYQINCALKRVRFLQQAAGVFP